MRLLVVGLLALLVGACAVAPPAPDRDPDVMWSERQRHLQAMDSWAFSGRAAVSGDELPSRTLRVHWSQDHEAFDLAFMTLLGQRVAEMRGGPGEAELRLPGEPPMTAADPSRLLLTVLGWTAPVESLRYWVLGLPDPRSASEPGPLDAWGRLTALSQLGWLVEFDRYVEADTLALPRRLTVTHPELRIRLIIDQWGD